jgi:hypothetical protein
MMDHIMGNLQPAHRGYEFQDLMIAARSVDLLLGDLVTAQADQKLVEGDRFDDLTIVDVLANRERIQFKHRDADDHALSLDTFTSDRRLLRFDKLVASAVADRDGPGATANSVHFRVLLRDGRPTDPELLHFLKPASIDPGAFLSGLPTYRMQFDADTIWPGSVSIGPRSLDGSDPFAFVRSSSLNRDDVAWLCERLTIEVEAPAMTGDLRAPGPAEVVLLNRAVSDVGAGQYPNEHRAPTDVAEAFISAARMARQGRTQLSVAELIARAQLRIDFGTVPHVDPLPATAAAPRSPGRLAPARPALMSARPPRASSREEFPPPRNTASTASTSPDHRHPRQPSSADTYTHPPLTSPASRPSRAEGAQLVAAAETMAQRAVTPRPRSRH